MRSLLPFYTLAGDVAVVVCVVEAVLGLIETSISQGSTDVCFFDG